MAWRRYPARKLEPASVPALPTRACLVQLAGLTVTSWCGDADGSEEAARPRAILTDSGAIRIWSAALPDIGSATERWIAEAFGRSASARRHASDLDAANPAAAAVATTGAGARARTGFRRASIPRTTSHDERANGRAPRPRHQHLPRVSVHGPFAFGPHAHDLATSVPAFRRMHGVMAWGGVGTLVPSRKAR